MIIIFVLAISLLLILNNQNEADIEEQKNSQWYHDQNQKNYGNTIIDEDTSNSSISNNDENTIFKDTDQNITVDLFEDNFETSELNMNTSLDQMNDIIIRINQRIADNIYLSNSENKIDTLIKIDNDCVKILSDFTVESLIEGRMRINATIGDYFTSDIKKYEYYTIARTQADILYTIVEDDTKELWKYYFAQYTYELANTNVSNSEELYLESIEDFNNYIQSHPYWSRHYIISSYRHLYSITEDEDYLYEALPYVEYELIENESLSKDEKSKLLIQASDLFYLLGEKKMYKDHDNAMINFEKSKEYINYSLKYGYQKYQEIQITKLEEILRNE
ncbi:hypothetical protein SANA_25320 [Gottschalkiaceae bacterium SANA]|nr:hypothetical protein SANA_25320 [Gottschalkiaceae bacterium SANA]